MSSSNHEDLQFNKPKIGDMIMFEYNRYDNFIDFEVIHYFAVSAIMNLTYFYRKVKSIKNCTIKCQ